MVPLKLCRLPITKTGFVVAANFNHLAQVKKLIQLNELKERINQMNRICSADIALLYWIILLLRGEESKLK